MKGRIASDDERYFGILRVEEQVCVSSHQPQKDAIIFPRSPKCRERRYAAKGITDFALPLWERGLSIRRAH